MSVMVRLGLTAIFAISCSLVIGRFWLESLQTQRVAVTTALVPAGSTASDVLKAINPELSARERALVFLLYPQFTHLQQGKYSFATDTTILSALSQIHRGEVIVERLTIPEGITADEFFLRVLDHQALFGALTVVDDRWLHLRDNWASHEGAFLAETYLWQQELSKDAMLEKAHLSLLEALELAWISADPVVHSVLKSPYELLILASIVEKETALAVERPRIAGVFLERIKRSMRLQTDPTVIYGLCDRFDGNLTRKHLREKTVYNTYRIDGLPPTPIALVGPDALDAVAHPEMTGELYFVADGHGGHVFSRTLDTHNANVRKYQLKQ
jgi:UPF0755 protein